MIGLTGGIFDGGENVVPFDAGVISENLLKACSGAEQGKNIGDTNAHPPNTGPSATLRVINRDSSQEIQIH